MINVVFFGNWGRGYKALRALSRLGNVNILSTFTQYDPQSNDKYYNVVYDYCTAEKIRVLNVRGEKGEQFNRQVLEWMEKLQNAVEVLGISVAFNKIFGKKLLSQLKVVNLHPSLLPKYRGPSPELWAIRNNESEIGVTLHYADEGIDTGDIILQQRFSIDYSLCLAEFAECLNAHSVDVLSAFLAGVKTIDEIQSFPQPHNEHYYKRISIKDKYWDMPLTELQKRLLEARLESG